MGGGGSESSTVTNRTEIDPVTQQWRQTLMNAGGQLYNQGSPAFYPGQTVTPFSNQTQGGLDYLQNYAQQGATNLPQANQAQARALSGWNPAMPMATNAAMGGLSGNPATQQLAQYGQGSNPHLQSLFNQGAEQISNAVNSNFAQAGRSGPNAAHSGALTRELGNLWTNINMPAYESERNRGLTAAQTMGGLYDSGANRTLQGVGLMGDMYSQGNADAARATALQPSLYSYGLMPGQSMLDVGSIYEGQAQNYLNADRERYDYNANAPWANLERYGQLLTGMPDFSGSTQTQTQPGPNRLMQGLGAASSIASLFAAFSDRRLKTDVARIGTRNGLPWYSFRYVWDAPGVAREGVMSDEVPPHAVIKHASGFDMVDYGAL